MTKLNKRCVVFAANRGYALKSSRENIIRHFIRQGWQVVLATADDKESRDLCESGAILEPVAFSRGGLSPVSDSTAYQRLRAIYKAYQPALVHHFHAKPVILGSLVARKVMGKEVAIVNAITGLGNAFAGGGLVSYLAGAGYRFSLPRADMTIFQNRDDQALFLKKEWVGLHNQSLIVGSGIDVDRFKSIDRRGHSADSPKIIMLGRLLKQKGAAEFVEVAQRVRAQWPQAKFIWAGEEDPGHPDEINAQWMHEQTDIEYAGRLTDVVPMMNGADILLFTSYYREGVPRVVMEAAATGLPTVAYDVPGVREAVRNGETGYLVPERDIDAMTAKVNMLIEGAELRHRLGAKARRLAEREFDVRQIQAAYFQTYRDLGIDIALPEGGSF